MARSSRTSSAGFPGRGVWVTAHARRRSTRRSSARSSRAASSATSAPRRTLRARSSGCSKRAALDALAIAHKAGPGRDRVRQDRSGARRRRRSRRSACRRMPRRTGFASSRRGCAGAQRRKCGRNPGHRGVYVGAIGFGIGAVKCGTCCPACRPRERRVPCALPQPRTLPDGRSGRTRRGIARGVSKRCAAGSGLDVNGD